VIRRVALAVLLLATVACKKGGATTSPDDPVASPPAGETPDEPADPNAPPKCTEAGRVWDGHHEGCLYEVGGCCYDGPEDACEAAGCAKDCQILESSPAQIACPKKE
jgi:hypothetical protein